MFSFHKQSIHVWGVANATPDSFSDGGDIRAPDDVLARIKAWQCDGLDIGAESTNPKATPITDTEERARLERVLLPLLGSWPQEMTLSLDSYRIKTVEWVLSQVPEHLRVVWNDVSGKGEEAAEFLQSHPRLGYVLCHNPAPRRELAALHMQHPLQGDAVTLVTTFFREQAEVLIRAGVFDRCIADPCLGFGKSREQNHALMAHLPALMESLPYPTWMWGVSRKSFLRFPADLDPRDPAVQRTLDGLQLLWIARGLEKLTTPHSIVLRAHAPDSLGALKLWPQMDATWKT